MDNTFVFYYEKAPRHAVYSNTNSIACPQLLVIRRGKHLLLVEVNVTFEESERAQALPKKLLVA